MGFDGKGKFVPYVDDQGRIFLEPEKGKKCKT
jgi:hypothetical protein